RRVLQQLERRTSLRIESDKLSIEHELTRQIDDRVANLRKSLIKSFLVSGEESDLGALFHSNASVAIEFNFKRPLLSWRQFRNRLSLHGLGEGRFRAPPRGSARRGRVRRLHSVAFPLRVLVISD